MRIASLLLLVTPALLHGCGDGDPPADPSPDHAPGRTEVVQPPETEGSSGTAGAPSPSEAREDDRARLVILGTSLTEGLGLARPSEDAWPARVQMLADSAGHPITVVNAGLSGETSAGALRRLDWVLRHEPDILVIETGANDGLRGLPVRQLEENLQRMIERARELHPGVRVALVEMEAPPNMGADYAESFRDVFGRVAGAYEATLIPFPLDGVAGVRGLNQEDGIHPTEEGHEAIARNAWPVLDSMFGAARAP